jgi:hypothetical protein
LINDNYVTSHDLHELPMSYRGCFGNKNLFHFILDHLLYSRRLVAIKSEKQMLESQNNKKWKDRKKTLAREDPSEMTGQRLFWNNKKFFSRQQKKKVYFYNLQNWLLVGHGRASRKRIRRGRRSIRISRLSGRRKWGAPILDG